MNMDLNMNTPNLKNSGSVTTVATLNNYQISRNSRFE